MADDISFKSFFLPFTTSKAMHYLILIGCVVYANALFNGFVWDDFSNIVYNPQIGDLSLSTLFQKSIINIGLQYRPLVSCYFSLLYVFFKDTPFFYHFFNIVFHITNGILVFLIFRKFFSIPWSFFLSAIFLVHPMQVESATFIATAGNIYFLFGACVFLLATDGKLTMKKNIVVGILLLLSLLAKETGILFAGAVCMYFVWHKKPYLKLFTITTILVTLLYAFLRFGVGGNALVDHSDILPIAKLPLQQRLTSVPTIVWYYFQTFFYPDKLAVMQHWVVTEKTWQNFFLPFLFAISIGSFFVGSTIFLLKTKKQFGMTFLFFFVWFCLGLFLHIHIFPLNMTVADRWFYFPMVGLLGMIGILFQQIINKKNLLLFLVFGTAMVTLLSVRTIIRNANWHDDLTLYMHDRTIHDNFIIENNIGWNYQHLHDFKKALPYYATSVSLYPHWAISLNNLAYAYEMTGDKQQARTYFFHVLKASDYHPEEYSHDLAFSGWALITFEKPAVAQHFLQQAVKKAPDNAFLRIHLARAYYALGNHSQAITEAKKATSLSSDSRIYAILTAIQNKKSVPQDLLLIN